MPYSVEISRSNPSCFLFLIDQSGSMDEKMENGKSKAQFVADVLNKNLAEIITRCTKDYNEGARNYFDIGVVGYGGESVGSGFGGNLGSQILHPLCDIANNPLHIEERTKKVDDGAGGIIDQSVKFPVWFEPRNSGGTPMCAALTKAAEVLVEWCDCHRTSYPPTIIHVTDGMSTDGSPEEIASTLKQISTDDGECLFFNLHVDTRNTQEIAFPSSELSLPDEYSKMLFRMSSNIPMHLSKYVQEKGYNVGLESRFFGYQAGMEVIVHFFEIGTKASQLR